MQQLYITTAAAAREAIAKVEAELGIDFDVYNPICLAEFAEQNRHRLPAISRTLLELNEEVDMFSLENYALLVAALTTGTPMLASNKVCIVGTVDGVDRYWPETWLDTLPEVNADVANKAGLAHFDHVILSGDAEMEDVEEEDLPYFDRLLNPNDFVSGWVKRSVVDAGVYEAMLVLMGAVKVGAPVYKHPVYEVRRGRDVVTFSFGDDGIAVGDKRLKRAYLCGGLVGVDGTLPFKAAYWGVWHALSGSSGNAMTGRLAYLTEFYEDQDTTEVREGIAKLRYDYTLGLLDPRADLSWQTGGVLAIEVGNGVRGDVLRGIEALDNVDLAWLPNHQVTALYWGLGAEALGIGFYGDILFANIPWHVKLEKILNRFALNKASVDFQLIHGA